MITVKNLPDRIVQSAQHYVKSGEKYDVFPAKFLVDNEFYYYFTFAPDAEQLIIRDDGVVLPLNEIKKPLLIADAYNTSIETVARTGFTWVKSNTKKIYKKLHQLLTDTNNIIEEKPTIIEESMTICIKATMDIVKEQEKIENAVEKVVRLGDSTNQKEIVTVEDRNQMREYVIQMGWAAFRQNEIQVETEIDRQHVLKYLSTKKWTNPKLFLKYVQIQRRMKHMLTSNSYEGRRMEEVRRTIEALEKETLEESAVREEIFNRFRNP